MSSSLRCTKTYVLWASRGTIWGNVGSEGRYDVFAGKTLWSISERLTGCFMIRHYTNAQLYLFMEYHICSQAHSKHSVIRLTEPGSAAARRWVSTMAAWTSEHHHCDQRHHHHHHHYCSLEDCSARQPAASSATTRCNKPTTVAQR